MQHPLVLVTLITLAACGGVTDPADEARAAMISGDHSRAVMAFDAAIAGEEDEAALLELKLDRLLALSYVGAEHAADEFLALADAHPAVGAREHRRQVRELIEAGEWEAARVVADALRSVSPDEADGLRAAIEKAETRAHAPQIDPNISSNPYVGGDE